MVFFAAGIGLLLTQIRFAPNRYVRLGDIPRVYEKLKAEGGEGSFAIFTFMPEGGINDEEAVNIQFSKEKGLVGLDWVLLGSTNLKDQETVRAFVESQGYWVREEEGNGVRYLRVDRGGGLAQLCQNILVEIYHIPPDLRLGLVPEGFRWP